MGFHEMMQSVPLLKQQRYDLIVVGGGIAGVSAAVAAARENISVLLLEKQINLGGLATGGMISWYEPLCNGKGKQVIFGIAEELIRLSVRDCFDSLPLQWGGTEKSAPRRNRYATRYSPTVFSLLLDEYVAANNVTVILDTYATYPVMDGNLCKGVIAESAEGRSFYPASVVVDATGDASIMFRAGVPCVEGENYLTYLTHNIEFSQVDCCIKENKPWAIRSWCNCGSDMEGNGHPDKLKKFKGLSAKEITEFVSLGKKMMLQKIRRNDRYSYDIMSIPTMPQLRTVRHIVGDSDYKAINGNIVSDSIGQIGDFRMSDKYCTNVYDVPLSALYNSAFPNLIAAGRIVSAPEYDDWETIRVIPACALTGEGAGRAAARYVHSGNFR